MKETTLTGSVAEIMLEKTKLSTKEILGCG